MAVVTAEKVAELTGAYRQIKAGKAAGSASEVNAGLTRTDTAIGPVLESMVARRNGGDWESARDGRYGILLSYYRHIETIDLEKYHSPVGWFVAAARNEGIDESRHNRSRPVKTDPLPDHDDYADFVFADPDQDPLVQLMAAERRRLVRMGMAQIPAEQREVLELWGDGYSQSEISEMTNNPLGTIKTRFGLGKPKLKRWLVQNGGEDFQQPIQHSPARRGHPGENVSAAKPESKVSGIADLKQKATLEINYFLGISPDEIAEIVHEPRHKVAGWIEQDLEWKFGNRLPDTLVRRRKLLQRPVTEIPLEHAVPVILRFMSELSTSQTAQVLELTVKQARTAIQNGLSSLDEIKDRIVAKAQPASAVKESFAQSLARQAFEGETMDETINRIVQESPSIAAAARFLGVDRTLLHYYIAKQTNKAA